MSSADAVAGWFQIHSGLFSRDVDPACDQVVLERTQNRSQRFLVSRLAAEGASTDIHAFGVM